MQVSHLENSSHNWRICPASNPYYPIKESDLAMGPFFPAEERLDIATPTSMFYVEDLRILAGRPKAEESNVFGYILAFDWMVWMFLMITLCTITVLTAAIKGCERRGKFCLKEMLRNMSDVFWQYVENLFFEASAEVPEKTSLRVVSATWWIAVVVLMNAFCGHLRACLMIKSEVEKINTVRQLIERPRTVPYMWKGTSYVGMVAHSSNEYLQQIGRVVHESNTAQPSSVLYGPKLLSRIVAGKAVIITDRTSLVFRVSSTCRIFDDGEFYLAEESLVSHPLNSFVRKDMDPKLRDDINRVIRRLVEAGLVNYWWRSAAGDMSTCSAGSQSESADTLAFSDMLAVFVLLLVGVLFAVVALVVELFCSRRKRVT
ncbi:glutamate receptor 2-like [Ornithodoros turicata]|uniref:glutamate receptor 2-like n=1 Tax=Ornithodoros turicata TaxID=34597 RepID=UPI0031389E8F